MVRRRHDRPDRHDVRRGEPAPARGSNAAGYWVGAGVHPPERGYDDIAARVARLLSQPS